VAFAGTERLIGDAAKNQAAMNPKNTVFDAKRLIGRRFDDPEVKADMKHWPFTLVDSDGSPQIQVEYMGETKTFTPQEISSMVLSKMKVCLTLREQIESASEASFFFSVIPIFIYDFSNF